MAAGDVSVVIARRTACSLASASAYNAGAGSAAAPDVATQAATTTINPIRRLRIRSIRSAELRVDFIEICRVDQHLARFSSRRRRYQAIDLHHVHESRRAAEADPQTALQVRNRRLTALDDDASGFVVEIVLFHLDAASDRFVVGGNGLVVNGLALFAQEAGEPGALLFGDIRSVQ